MDHFDYANGRLCAEQVPLAHIAAEVGTPFYCYSTATIERHFNVLNDALSGMSATLCYAVKANSNIAVIKSLADLGSGADVVSSGELDRARAAGVPADKIVFSGVGKTTEEIEHALRERILQINVESEPEIARVNSVAQSLGVRAPIALRINPDIDAKTHDKVSTGRKEDKFGVDWSRTHEIVKSLGAFPHVELVGLAMHIGSQLTSLDPFRSAFQRMRDLIGEVEALGCQIRTVDLGGGLGIPYESDLPPTPEAYASVVREIFGDLNYKLLFEPGRLIVGNAGILVTKALYVKEGDHRKFLIVDAAMNDLLRPSLYDATHRIVPVAEPAGQAEEPYDVVGPICETGDKFGEAVTLPSAGEDDLYAIRSAGAYGAVMSSTYNSRPLVPEVLVKGDRFWIIRRRVEIEELLGYESLPDWMVETPEMKEAK